MILITTGTTSIPFERMVQAASEIAGCNRKKERIIFQYGAADVAGIRHPAMNMYRELPFDRLQKLIREARVVLTHGGPATIYQTISIGKKPFVMPRMKRYGEHVNDHQVEYCTYMEKIGKVRLYANPHDVFRNEAGLHAGGLVDARRFRSLLSFLEELL